MTQETRTTDLIKNAIKLKDPRDYSVTLERGASQRPRLPIHEAIQRGQTSIVKEICYERRGDPLIDECSDIADCCWNETPLMVAVQATHLPISDQEIIVEELMKAGASLNRIDFAGRSPLALALLSSVIQCPQSPPDLPWLAKGTPVLVYHDKLWKAATVEIFGQKRCENHTKSIYNVLLTGSRQVLKGVEANNVCVDSIPESNNIHLGMTIIYKDNDSARVCTSYTIVAFNSMRGYDLQLVEDEDGASDEKSESPYFKRRLECISELQLRVPPQELRDLVVPTEGQLYPGKSVQILLMDWKNFKQGRVQGRNRVNGHYNILLSGTVELLTDIKLHSIRIDGPQQSTEKDPNTIIKLLIHERREHGTGDFITQIEKNALNPLFSPEEWASVPESQRRPLPVGNISKEQPLSGTCVIAISCLLSNIKALELLKHVHSGDAGQLECPRSAIRTKDDLEDWYRNIEAIDLIQDPSILKFFINLKARYSLSQAVRWSTQERCAEWVEVITDILATGTECWEALSPVDHGLNAIQWASWKGSLPILKSLLQQSPHGSKASQIIKEPSRAGRHPLYLAIKSHVGEEVKIEIVRLLIMNGIVLQHSYALTAAAEEGLMSIAKLLLEEGCLLNESFNGISPTQAATSFDMFKMLEEHREKNNLRRVKLHPITIVMKVIEDSREDTWLSLFKKDNQWNEQDWKTRDPETGHTALTAAISSCNVNLVEKLLQEPHCVSDYPNARGDHPVFYACQCGSSEILEILLKHKPIPSNGIRGTKALPLSCKLGKYSIIKQLLNHQIDFEETYEGKTALDWTCEILKGEEFDNVIRQIAMKVPVPLDLVIKNNNKILLEVIKANRERCSSQPGSSKALLYAIQKGDLESITVLIKKAGVNPFIDHVNNTNVVSSSPIIACFESSGKNRLRVLEVLLSSKQKPSLEIDHYTEILSKAISENDEQAIHLLSNTKCFETNQSTGITHNDLVSLDLVKKGLIPNIANLAKEGRFKLVNDILDYYVHEKKDEMLLTQTNERSTEPSHTEFNNADRSALSWMLTTPYLTALTSVFKIHITADGGTEYHEGKAVNSTELQKVGLMRWQRRQEESIIVRLRDLMSAASKEDLAGPGQAVLLRNNRGSETYYTKVHLVECIESGWYVSDNAMLTDLSDEVSKKHIIAAAFEDLIPVRKLADESNQKAIERFKKRCPPLKDICLSDENGVDVLQLAAQGGNVKLIKNTLEIVKKDNRHQRVSRATPCSTCASAICAAATAGRVKAVTLLVDEKVASYEAEWQGRCLGRWASTREVFDVVVNSVKQKPSTTTLNYDLFTCCRRGWLDKTTLPSAIEQLNESHPSTGTTALMEAAKGYHQNLVNDLLTRDVDIIRFDKQGRSILTIIASLERKGTSTTAEVGLLELVLDKLTSQDKYNSDTLRTFFKESRALCAALSLSQPRMDMVNALLKKGVSLPNEINQGKSAIRHLTTADGGECAKRLIKKLLQWKVKVYNKSNSKNEIKRVVQRDAKFERLRVISHDKCHNQKRIQWINKSEVIGPVNKGLAANGKMLHSDFIHIIHMGWNDAAAMMINRGVIEGYHLRTLPYVAPDSIKESLLWCVKLLRRSWNSQESVSSCAYPPQWEMLRELLQGLFDAHEHPYGCYTNQIALGEAVNEIFEDEEGYPWGFIPLWLYRETVTAHLFDGNNSRKSVFLSNLFASHKLQLIKQLCASHSRHLRNGSCKSQRDFDLFKQLYSNNGELEVIAENGWTDAVEWLLVENKHSANATTTAMKPIQTVSIEIDKRIQEIIGYVLHIKYHESPSDNPKASYVHFMKDCRPRVVFSEEDEQDFLHTSLDDAVIDIANRNNLIMAYVKTAFILLRHGANADPMDLEKLSQIMRLDVRFNKTEDTLLHIAASCDNAKSVSWLLENPSYTNTLGVGILEDARGRTARHYVKSSHECYSILSNREQQAGIINGYMPLSSQVHLIIALRVKAVWEPKDLLSVIAPIGILHRQLNAHSRNHVIGAEAVVRALNEMDLCGYIIRTPDDDPEGDVYVAVSGTAQSLRIACERVPHLSTSSSELLSKEEHSITSHIINSFTWPVDNIILQKAVSVIYRAALRERNPAEVLQLNPLRPSEQHRNECWIISGAWLNTGRLIKYPEEIRITVQRNDFDRKIINGVYRFSSIAPEMTWILSSDDTMRLHLYRETGQWEIKSIDATSSVAEVYFKLSHPIRGVIPNASTKWQKKEGKHWMPCDDVNFTVREEKKLGIKSIHVLATLIPERITGLYVQHSNNVFKLGDKYFLEYTSRNSKSFTCLLYDNCSQVKPVLIYANYNNTWYKTVPNSKEKEVLPYVCITLDIEYGEQTRWETIDNNNDAVFSLHRDIHDELNPREMTRRLIDAVQNLDSGVPEVIEINNSNRIPELNGEYIRCRENSSDALGWHWVNGLNTLSAVHTRIAGPKVIECSLDSPIDVEWILTNCKKDKDGRKQETKYTQKSRTAPWYTPGVWTISGVSINATNLGTFTVPFDNVIPEKEAKKLQKAKFSAFWAVRQLLRAAGMKDEELPFSKVQPSTMTTNTDYRPPTMDLNGVQPLGQKWIEYLKGSDKITQVFGIHNPVEVENVLKHWQPKYVDRLTFFFSLFKPWHWQPFKSLSEFLREPSERKHVKKYDPVTQKSFTQTVFLAQSKDGHSKSMAEWDRLEFMSAAAMVVPLFFEINTSYYDLDLSKTLQSSHFETFSTELKKTLTELSWLQLKRLVRASTCCLVDSFQDPVAKRQGFDNCLRHKEYFRLITRIDDWVQIEKECEFFLAAIEDFHELREGDDEKSNAKHSNKFKAIKEGVAYYRVDDINEKCNVPPLAKGSIIQVDGVAATGKWIKLKHHENLTYRVKYWMPVYTPDKLQEVTLPHYMEHCSSLERYLGSKIAFYFAFSSMYCSYLLLLFLSGVVFTSIQIMLGFYKSEKFVIWNAVVVTIWAARFRERWRRKASELASIWDVHNVESWEPPSAAFLKRNSHEKTSPNPITGAMEPSFGKYRRALRYLVSIAVTAIMAFIVICVNIGNVYLRDTYGYNSLESKVAFGIENAVTINILDAIFAIIAKFLDVYENHRTLSRSQASAILKNFTFRFINGYSGLIVTAIREPRDACPCYSFCHSACSQKDPLIRDFSLCKSEEYMNECISGQRLRDLTVQLTTLLVIQSLLSLLFEKILPFVYLTVHSKKKENQQKTKDGFPRCISNFQLTPFKSSTHFSIHGHLYTIKFKGPYEALGLGSDQYGGIWVKATTDFSQAIPGVEFKIFETLDLGWHCQQLAFCQIGELPVLFDSQCKSDFMERSPIESESPPWLEVSNEEKWSRLGVYKNGAKVNYDRLTVHTADGKSFNIMRDVVTRTGKTADSGKISLSSKDRSIRKIPQAATHFRWCYPLPSLAKDMGVWKPKTTDKESVVDEENAHDLVMTGAFVYTSQKEGSIVVESLQAGAPTEGENALRFKDGAKWKDEYTKDLWDKGRFQPVTIAEFREHGAKYFCWLSPGEELVRGEHGKWKVSMGGNFVYLFDDHSDLNELLPKKVPHPDVRNKYFCVQARQNDGKKSILLETVKRPISEEKEFNDYTMMVLQFSYVVCFASVLPLAPFVALVTGTIELHSDLIKFLKLSQRPEAKKASDIGAWLVLLSVVIYISVPINVVVMFHGFGWRTYSTDHEDGKFTAALFVTTAGLALIIMIRRCISSTAEWVHNDSSRKDYEIHREQSSQSPP